MTVTAPRIKSIDFNTGLIGGVRGQATQQDVFVAAGWRRGFPRAWYATTGRGPTLYTGEATSKGRVYAVALPSNPLDRRASLQG